MAIVAGNTTTVALSTRVDTTATKPTGVASGDVMYAHLLTGNAGFASPVTVTPPSGWTLINGAPGVGNSAPDNFIVKLYVYRKVAGGSEPANYTWSHASASAEMFLKNWTGVDNVTPEDKAVVDNTSILQGVAQGQTVTINPGTTVTNGAQVVAADTAWDAPGAGSYSGTTPTLTTELTGGLLKVASGNLATAGATGSRTRTNGNGSVDSTTGWTATAYAIRPASGASTKAPPPYRSTSPRRFTIPAGFSRGIRR